MMHSQRQTCKNQNLPAIPSPAAYWDRRFQQYAGSYGGYKAICSYGMPYLYNKYIDLIQKKAFRIALRSLQVRDKNILDVGCGNGRWCRLLAKKGAIVTGIDISGEAIDTAKAMTEDSRVNFFNTSISRADLPSQSFDIVTSVTVLQHLTEQEEFEKSIGNMIRVLKANGKILLLEVAPSVPPASEGFASTLTVRGEADYISAFEKKGALLERILSMDVLPIIQKRLVPASGRMPAFLYRFLVYISVLISLPVDYFFSGSRLFLRNSWHKVFLFSMASDRVRTEP